jgi:dTDP-glucose 4,6-dehydratase
MTHVILTGAAGFVGSHLLRHLIVNTDWTIACPVTFRHKGLPRRITVALRELPADVSERNEPTERISVVRCDLSSPVDELTRKALGVDRAELIFNVASQSHVDRSITDPVPFVENNVSLMLNVLEMARQAPHLRALLQVSTDEVYGPADVGYDSREWDPIVPSNPYAASKAAQEAIAISYWRTYGIPLILTNTMNIIGETQDAEKFIPKTISKLMRGEQVTIHAQPGEQRTGQAASLHGHSSGMKIGSRFYLHARNQADALLFLAKQTTDPFWFALGHMERTNLEGYSEGLRYELDYYDRPPRYSIVGEQEMNNLEVAAFLRHELVELGAIDGAASDWYTLEDFHSSRPGHDLRYALDGSKMDGVGWKPPVPLLDSLRKTVRWTLDHPEWLS